MDHSFDTCFDVRSALPLFVGGDLEIEELRAVESHLETCPSCQEHHHRAREARAVLTSRRDEPLTVGKGLDLWTGVRAQLATEGAFAGPRGPRALEVIPTPLPTQRHTLRAVPLVPLGVLSAAAAVVCAFLLAGFFDPEGSPEAGPGLGNIAGTGGEVVDVHSVVSDDSGETVVPATPVRVDRPAGHLRPLPEGAEFMYLRAREMHTEQGIVAPGGDHR